MEDKKLVSLDILRWGVCLKPVLEVLIFVLIRYVDLWMSGTKCSRKMSECVCLSEPYV